MLRHDNFTSRVKTQNFINNKESYKSLNGKRSTNIPRSVSDVLKMSNMKSTNMLLRYFDVDRVVNKEPSRSMNDIGCRNKIQS